MTNRSRTVQESDVNRRLSRSSSERIIFYMDDTSFEVSHEPSPDHCHQSNNSYTLYPTESGTFYPLDPDATGFQLDERSTLYPSSNDDEPRRNVSGHSKTGNSKQGKNNSELDQRPSRRSSVQSSRSRTNSCSKPTPLGRRQLGHQTFRSIRNAPALFVTPPFRDVITISRSPINFVDR